MSDTISTPPQGISSEAEVTFSPFVTLLSDAINFCHLAENPSLTAFSRASLARASILSTVFAVECVANILLERLDLSKQMYSQFERLPVLDKFGLCFC
jgi:hypothetical protein